MSAAEIEIPPAFFEQELLFEPREKVLLIGNVSVGATCSVEYDFASEAEIEYFAIAVTNTGVELPSLRFSRDRFAHWSLSDYRSFGGWIFPLINDVMSGDGKPSDHVILTRSSKLGASPKRDMIRDPRRFRSVANFVKESGAEPSVRYGKYDHLTFDDLVVHIKNVIVEEDTAKITQPMLWRRINKDGKDEPSPTIIRKIADKLTGINGFSEVLKAAGVRSKVHMNKDEYLLMGLEEMIATGGKGVTVERQEERGKQGKAHHSAPIIERFGTWATYKQAVKEEFDAIVTDLGIEIIDGTLSSQATHEMNNVIRQKWGEVNEFMQDEDIGLGFPPGFMKRIRKLEHKLNNPPPLSVMLKELRDKSERNATSD